MDQYIYSLSDPRNGSVRYVGKTDFPKHREWAHRSVGKGRSRRQRWVKGLRAAGLNPVFDILEIVTDGNWAQAERKWIASFRSAGASLLNYDDGGRGAVSGGSQSRMHYLKRELGGIYRSLLKAHPETASRVAMRLRSLHQRLPNECPNWWRTIGLRGTPDTPHP